MVNKCISRLTGDINNGTYTTKTSNIMKVSWQPKGGVNVKGLAVRKYIIRRFSINNSDIADDLPCRLNLQDSIRDSFQMR